ncbi:MAG: hypothetical protein Q4G08_08465 [Capnocytophaga sp.]|nr:hypothetical protein [Capnocytophaga sp.]
MFKERIQKRLQLYFDCISDKNYEKYFELLLPEFQDKIQISDLNYIFGINSSKALVYFELIDVEEEVYYKDYKIFRLNYQFNINDSIQNTFVFIFFENEFEDIVFLPYLSEKKEIIFQFLPNSIVNSILRTEDIDYKVELVPYPDFEDVFINETNPKAKYVFLPLVSIKLFNHKELGTKTFHIISIWDTGNYEKEYLGEYRIDVNEIRFDIIGDKLGYKDEINFPKIEYLEQAYQIIKNDFDIEKDNYLNDLDYSSKSKKIQRGGNLILEKIPDFGKFEAKYYFERITSVLLSKYRYSKYGIVNSLFDNNSYYLHKVSDGKIDEKTILNTDFNTLGKTNFIDNLLLRPDFIQNDETPNGTIFIGQVDEWDYISSSSTNTFLFFDPKENKQIQIFQWD